MSAEMGRVPEPVDWAANRNFIVPPDIVPVRRVSPIRKKPRTVCRPQVEGTAVCRSGNREWFSDHVFVDCESPDLRNACGTSFTAHASCVIGVLVLLAGPAPTTPVRVNSPLRMPAFVAVIGGGGSAGAMLHAPSAAPAAPPSASPSASRPPAAAKPAPIRPAAPVPQQAPKDAAATINADQFEEPLDSHSSTSDGSSAEVADAKGDAIVGGNGSGGGTGTGFGGGTGDGVGPGSKGIGMSPGPYRVGQGIEPPRKIKDVAPIYPAAALTARAFGTVIVEATVDVDGKVHDARVVHSIPSLDQAALDAVRQWEFEPSRLNGTPVAVIVTVLVQFAIH